MIETELQILAENPEWRTLLESYQGGIELAKKADAEFGGWLPRLRSVEGIPQEWLSSIHGKLIAYGFLKFQLADRSAGIAYQLSALAKQALSSDAKTLDFELDAA